MTQAYAFDGFFRDDAAFALNQQAIKAALVPEPTTATLSLLALCGLAARRRRRRCDFGVTSAALPWLSLQGRGRTP